MSENYILYVIALLAVIIGFLIVKKVASCLIKAIVALFGVYLLCLFLCGLNGSYRVVPIGKK